MHVDDLARAYVLALKHGKAGNVYNITSSNDATVRWGALNSCPQHLVLPDQASSCCTCQSGAAHLMPAWQLCSSACMPCCHALPQGQLLVVCTLRVHG